MSDISCAADIYAAMREHVFGEDLETVANKAVEIFLDEGYSLMQIEQALGDFDEIYDAIEDHTDYGEEYEVEVEEDEEEMEDDEYYSDEE